MHIWIVLVVLLLLGCGAWAQDVSHALSMCCGCAVVGSSSNWSVRGARDSYIHFVCGIVWRSVFHCGGGLLAVRVSCPMLPFLLRVIRGLLWQGVPRSSKERISADGLLTLAQCLEMCVDDLVSEWIDSACDLVVHPRLASVCSQCGVLQKLSHRGALHHPCEVRGF